MLNPLVKISVIKENETLLGPGVPLPSVTGESSANFIPLLFLNYVNLHSNLFHFVTFHIIFSDLSRNNHNFAFYCN